MSDPGYNEIKIRVTTTAEDAERDFDKIDRKGIELGKKEVRVPVTASDPVTEEWRKKVQAEIRSVSKEALKIPMDAESAQFRADVASTLAELKDIAKEPVPLEVADADKFRASVEAAVAEVRAEVRAVTVPVVAEDAKPSPTSMARDLTPHVAVEDNPPAFREIPVTAKVVGDPYADVVKKIGQEPEPTIPIKALDPIDAAWVAKVQAGVRAAARESLKIPADPKFDGFRAKLAAELAGVMANVKAGIPMDLKDRERFRAEAIETVESLQAEVKARIPVEPEPDKAKAEAAGRQMSGLMVSAAAGGAVAGGPVIGTALVGGMAVGMAALGAYLVRGDPAVQQGWHKLVDDAKASAQQASGSMVKPVSDALRQLDQVVTQEKPDWQRLFAGAAEGIPEITSGLADLTHNALPGLDDAMDHAKDIAKGFGDIERQVGTLIGSVGDATAKNASTIGSDMSELAGTVKIVGGALSDLIGITSNLGHGALPVLNGALSIVESGLRGVDSAAGPLVSSLGTVGGAALTAWGGVRLFQLGAAGLKSGVSAVTSVSTAAANGILSFGARVESSAPRVANLSLKTAGLVSTLGPAGLIGAAGAAVIAIAALDKQQQHEAQVSKDQASAALIVANALKQANGAINETSRAQTAATLQGQQWVQDLTSQGISLKDITDAALGVPGALQKVQDEVGKLGTAWSATGGEGSRLADNVLKGVSGGLLSNGDASNKARDALGILDGVSGQATKDLKELAEASASSAKPLADMVFPADTAANGFQSLITSMQETQNQENLLGSATSALVLKLQTMGESGMQKVNDSIRSFAQDLENDTSQIKNATGKIFDSSGALDNFSAKGRAVAKLLEDAQSDWASYATGAKQAGVSTAGMETELENLRGDLEKSLGGLGLNKDAADKLIDSFGLIPKSIATDVSAPGAAEAFTNVETLHNQLKALPPGQSIIVTGLTRDAEDKLKQLGYDVTHLPEGRVMVSADTTLAIRAARNAVATINGMKGVIDIQGNFQQVSTGPIKMKAAGGIVGAAAAGGVKGGWTIVGEQGIEAMKIQPGTQVMPNANTNAMLRDSGGGQDVRVVIEFGAGADTGLASWFKNAVRTGQIRFTTNGTTVGVG